MAVNTRKISLINKNNNLVVPSQLCLLSLITVYSTFFLHNVNSTLIFRLHRSSFRSNRIKISWDITYYKTSPSLKVVKLYDDSETLYTYHGYIFNNCQ